MTQDNNQDVHRDNALRPIEGALISAHEDADKKARVERLAIPHCSGFTESHVHCAKPGRDRTNAQQRLRLHPPAVYPEAWVMLLMLDIVCAIPACVASWKMGL